MQGTSRSICRCHPRSRTRYWRFSTRMASTTRTILEFSAGQALWVEAVRVLGATGGLAALATVINTLIRRNDGKTVVIDRGDEKIEIAGHSLKEVERMLDKRAEEQTARDAEWHRIKRL